MHETSPAVASRSQRGPFVLALDSGTTSVRAILFDGSGAEVASASLPLTQRYPQPGWVEHDPIELLDNQVASIREVLAKSSVAPGEVSALGITNQRETTVVWDRATGEPVYNAICWQCRRTEPMVSRLKDEGVDRLVRDRTGLVIDPYFSSSKIAWILDRVDRNRERARRGDLLFGTVDTWLIWNLTNRRVHATDRTNASRTMLFDIHRLSWDDDLLALFDIPRPMLPEVLPSVAHYGDVDPSFFGCPIPVWGVAGDQQASLFGHRCFAPGDVKATYGTGCFILMNTGEQAIESTKGLVTTLAATDSNHVEYALEGSVFNAGSVVQWLVEEMRLVDSASETEQIAWSVPDSGGVFLVPAFTGLGAPWWDANARGLICGITRGTTRAHIVRAALEGVAYQVADVITAMKEDAGRPISRLSVDGGGTRNSFTMQWQANTLGCCIDCSPTKETTSLGAAYLAGIGAGIWSDRDALNGLARNLAGANSPRFTAAPHFEPLMGEEERKKLLAGWRDALGRSSSHVARY